MHRNTRGSAKILSRCASPTAKPAPGFAETVPFILRALAALRGKWKVLLLWELYQGTRRPAELRRALPGITQKILTLCLRELQADGMIARREFPGYPARVEYRLSALGYQIVPAMDGLRALGVRLESRRPDSEGLPRC